MQVSKSSIIPHEWHEILQFSKPTDDNPWGYGMEERRALLNDPAVQYHWRGGGCALCGAHYTYGSIFRHENGVDVMEVGWICAEKVGLLTDSVSQEVIRQMRSEARERIVRRHRLRRVVLALRDVPGLLQALRCKHPIVRDIRSRCIKHADTPSDKQTALVIKLAQEELHKTSQAAQDAERTWMPAPEGKQTVDGVILSVKARENVYSGRWENKVTLRIEDASGCDWKAWGTLPKAIIDQLHKEYERTPDEGWFAVLRNRRIRFTATFTRSREDESFAFFKGPSKASLVTE